MTPGWSASLDTPIQALGYAVVLSVWSTTLLALGAWAFSKTRRGASPSARHWALSPPSSAGSSAAASSGGCWRTPTALWLFRSPRLATARFRASVPMAPIGPFLSRAA